MLAAAKREFEEEIGIRVDSDSFLDLGMVRQSKTKNVSVWALERDYDPSTLKSNTCEIEYPAVRATPDDSRNRPSTVV